MTFPVMLYNACNGLFIIIELICHSLIFQGEVIPFKSYLHRIATPYTASKSTNPLWYAIRRASAHIIVLSSYSPYGNLSHFHK